jgi:radical SAM protein with 4Fe4S-binding SPASM domain
MGATMKSQVGNNRLPLEESIPLRSPLVVYVEPSGYCNLKCKFCPHGISPDLLKKSFMSVNVFGKLVDDMLMFPDKAKLLRVCGNGEPLMNKHLPDMLRLAAQEKVAPRIELLTNGLLINDDLAQLLPKYASRIICSVEGLSDEDYKRFCGANVDFRKFLEKLDALYAQRNNCTIHIKIHHEAVKTEEDEKRFFEIFGGRCDEIFIEKLVPMWPQLDAQYASTQFRWGDEAVVGRKVCAQIFKGLQVQADGDVVPCCVDWKRKNLLGNIQSDRLVDIWNGDKLNRLQMNHLGGRKDTIEPCRDCKMNDYCEVDNIDNSACECRDRMKAGTSDESN